MKIEDLPCVFSNTKQDEALTEGESKKRFLVGDFKIRIPMATDAVIATLDKTLAPGVKGLASEIAAIVEDGGRDGSQYKPARQIPTMIVELWPRDDDDRGKDPVFRLTAKVKNPTVTINKKGDGHLDFKINGRMTAGDMSKITEWYGADMAITMYDAQLTTEDHINAALSAEQPARGPN